MHQLFKMYKAPRGCIIKYTPQHEGVGLSILHTYKHPDDLNYS